MKKFEVGESYELIERRWDPYRVLRRTQKTVMVTNGASVWTMRIRVDEDGDEYCIDSKTFRGRWKELGKCSAKWLVNEGR